MTTRKQIREFGRRLAREFKPRRIVLFGSYAYGNPRPDSDVDLLVVMPLDGNPVDLHIRPAERQFSVSPAGRTRAPEGALLEAFAGFGDLSP